MSKNVYQLYIQIGDGGNSDLISDSQNSTSKTDAKKGITLLTVYNAVEPFINSTRQIIENDVKTNYASTELSSRVNLGLSIASMGIKTAVSVASGVSLASALGISTTFGGAVGAVLAVGTIVANYAVKVNELNNNMKIENEQLNVLRGRMGVQFNKSRIGE